MFEGKASSARAELAKFDVHIYNRPGSGQRRVLPFAYYECYEGEVASNSSVLDQGFPKGGYYSGWYAYCESYE